MRLMSGRNPIAQIYAKKITNRRPPSTIFASKSDCSSTVRDAKSGIMKNSPIPISSPNVIISPVPTLPSSAPSSPDLDESCSFEAMV